MGEIAEDMVDGQSCSWCGVYFEHSHGYPVICVDCYTDWSVANHNYPDTHKDIKELLLKKHALQVATEKEL